MDSIGIRLANVICEQQTPVVLNITPVPGEIFPLPRFWFHSGPRSALVQVQRGGFFFHWRKDNENEYPHYKAVREQFCKEIETELAPVV